MISRRAFLSALAALPFVSRLFQQEPSYNYMASKLISRCETWGAPKSYTSYYLLLDNQGICAQYDFDQQEWMVYRQPNEDLSNLKGLVTQRVMTRAELDAMYRS